MADDHVIMREDESVVRAAQRTHADECCGRAGVQRGMRCVLEVRVVQVAYIGSVACPGAACEFSMFARVRKESKNSNRLGAAPQGRRPCLVVCTLRELAEPALRTPPLSACPQGLAAAIIQAALDAIKCSLSR